MAGPCKVFPFPLGVVIGVGCRPAFLREADRSPEPPTPAPTGSQQPALPALLLVSTCGLATVNTRELSGKRPAFTDSRGRWRGAESRVAPRPRKGHSPAPGLPCRAVGPSRRTSMCLRWRAAGPPVCQPGCFVLGVCTPPAPSSPVPPPLADAAQSPHRLLGSVPVLSTSTWQLNFYV